MLDAVAFGGGEGGGGGNGGGGDGGGGGFGGLSHGLSALDMVLHTQPFTRPRQLTACSA